MNDFQQITETLDPEALECIEGILERMAMVTIRKNTGQMIFEMHFDRGSIVYSHWKGQMASARRRVRSAGI